ncbi:hypothetical protein [Luxibacter massiliensis]|uniref:hypothetical protein n=1 Tax=Luxibacter massiliensis TaxID=2219695 RepID=UPI001F288B2C|nr:hypothetical protein [Luxibacter massiliensis]
MNEEDFLQMIMTERMQMHYQRYGEQHPVRPEQLQEDKRIEQAYERLQEHLNAEDPKLLREYVNAITADIVKENFSARQAPGMASTWSSLSKNGKIICKTEELFGSIPLQLLVERMHIASINAIL